MRRITLWFMSTVTLLVLLFSYRTSTVGLHSAGAVPVLTTPAPKTTSAPGATTTPAPVKTASGATATPKATATTPAASQTVQGSVAQTRWGDVQVTLTVTSGKIVAVDVPAYPNGNFRDQEINARALPELVQETLAAQSAQIDSVSGATVTSDGYVESLQAALDAAHLS